MSFFKIISELFFPSGIKCIVCDDDIPRGGRFPVCRRCVLEKNLCFCRRCGRNMPIPEQFCSRCKCEKIPFEKARAPFVYSGNVRKAIHKLKYGGGKCLASELSVYLADAYYEHGFSPDVITFVPMHPRKEKTRGYNQAEALAVELGKAVGVEVISLLIKKVFVRSNASQNYASRIESVKNTVGINRESGFDLKGKTVLLVDDVFTTGATAGECSRVLLSGGAKSVSVLTLATGLSADGNIPCDKKMKKNM